MAKQRMVDSKFWSDPWVVDELNPLDRYLFLYLLTNEKTSIAGIYEMSLRTMANESGIDKEELLRMMQRLESRVVFKNGWVVLRKFIKHQNYKSPKIKTGIVEVLSGCPRELLQYVEIPDDLEIPFDTVYIPPEAISHSNSNTNTNTNLNTNTNPNTNTAAPGDDKKSVQKKSDPEIDEMFAVWADVVGFEIKTGREKNRRACSNLLKSYGKDKLTQLIQGVAKSLDDRYAPRISDFSSLQTKLNDLLVWGRKKGITNGQRGVDLTQ